MWCQRVNFLDRVGTVRRILLENLPIDLSEAAVCDRIEAEMSNLDANNPEVRREGEFRLKRHSSSTWKYLDFLERRVEDFAVTSR